MCNDSTGRDEVYELWLEFDSNPPAPSVIAEWRTFASEELILRAVRDVGERGLLHSYRRIFGRFLGQRRQAELMARRRGLFLVPNPERPTGGSEVRA